MENLLDVQIIQNVNLQVTLVKYDKKIFYNAY